MKRENLTEDEASFKEFLAEAEEIIETLNTDLMSLGDSGKADPEILNSIFRAAHSLKSLSGMFGLDSMTKLSHDLEDLLDSLRLGKLDLTPALVDLLFESVAVVHTLLEIKSRGEKVGPEIKVMVERVNTAINDYCEDLKGGDGELVQSGVDRAILNVLTEYEEHRLFACTKEGLNLFKIQVSFPIMTFDQGLAEITITLKEKGEIITTLPSPGATSGDIINFDIVLATVFEIGDIVKAVDNKDIKISTMVGSSAKLAEPEALAEAAGSVATEQAGKEGADIKSITQTVRVDITKLDGLMNIVGEIVLLKGSVEQASREAAMLDNGKALGASLLKTRDGLAKRLYELQEGLIETRLVPLSIVFDKVYRAVRKLSRETGKEVDFEVSGGETKLDKIIVEELGNSLLHLVRNAVDHAIESAQERKDANKPAKGLIKINASHKGNHVVVEIEDDGRGIDHNRLLRKAIELGMATEGTILKKEEILDFMFRPGFSTSDKVSEISGRGVGMDVVKKSISDLSGIVEIDTEVGRGTKVSLMLPMTLAIIQALIVEVSDKCYAVPLNSVLENFILEPSEIETIETKEFVSLRDKTLPLLRLSSHFTQQEDDECREGYVVVVGLAEKRLGLVVDKLLGQQDIVMKSMGRRFDETKSIACATDYGQKTILVLDVGGIINECMGVQGSYRIEGA